MNRIKVIKDTNFTVINNEFIFNKDMSLKAKGLLCHLLALPSDWVLYVEEVANWHTDGKGSIYTAFKELKNGGYVERVVKREKGKIVSHEYIVYEKPKSLIEKQHIEKPNVEIQHVENDTLLSTDKTNNLIKLNNINKEDSFKREVLKLVVELDFKDGENFIDYWTEKSHNDKKARWEKQSSFDIKRRIQRWMRNSKNDSNKSKVETTLDNWQKARKLINE